MNNRVADPHARSATERFLPRPISVGGARHFVRRVLAGHSDPQLLPRVELVVSEAVTNALVHAGTSIEVTVTIGDDGVLLEVTDASPHLPQRPGYGATAGTGRGLMIIEDLVTAWGSEPREGGKTVWFDFGLDDSTAQAHAAEATIPPGHADQAHRIRLVDFPGVLYLAWREFADTVLRELLLARLDQMDDDRAVQSHAESSQALALLAEHIAVPQLSDDPGAVLADAAEDPPAERTQVWVPPASIAQFTILDRTLEEAAALSEEQIFLTPPVQPELRQFRRWLCAEVVAQAAGQPPTAWSAEHDLEPPAAPASTPLSWSPAEVAGAAEPLVAADDTNGIVATSRAAALLLGYDDPSELVGRRLISIIPDRFRQAHVAGFTLHLLNGRDALLGTPVDVPLLRRDGSETTARMTITATRTAEGRAVFVASLTALTG